MENKNTGLKILVGILVVLVLLLGGFIVYDKVLKNNNSQNNNDNTNGDKQTTAVLTNEEALTKGKELYDKANEIYEVWTLRPYCGYSSSEIDSRETEELGSSGLGNGSYYYSGYRSLDELKEFLSNYLSKELINDKYNVTPVTDLSLLSDSNYSYTNFVIKDNKLYCRAQTGKGAMSGYIDYDIEVNTLEENKITYKVTSKNAKINTECYSKVSFNGDASSCTDADFEYQTENFAIEKNSNDNFVVTEFTIHK